MEPQRKVQDLLLCFNCLNTNMSLQPCYTFVLECKHVMCNGCHYNKLQVQPEQPLYYLYCSICSVVRAIDYTLTQQIREGQEAYYKYCHDSLDFTLVPCRRCPQDAIQSNCPFDHSDYSYAQLTLAEKRPKIWIRTCGRCKIRSEGARCVRCQGNVDRLEIIKPQRLEFHPQLHFPY